MMLHPLYYSIFFYIAISAQQYASVEKLNTLLLVDENIVKKLKQFLGSIKDQKMGKILRRYINTSTKFSKVAESNENPFYHPLNGYHFIKHSMYNWDRISLALRNENRSSAETLVKNIEELRNNARYPIFEDLLYAAAGISRMQHFFRLPMDALAQGKVEDKSTGQVFQSIDPLNAWDCLEVGRGSLQLTKYEGAIQWFNFALRKIENGDKSVNITIVKSYEEVTKTKLKNWISPLKESLERHTDEEFAALANHPLFRRMLMDYKDRLDDPMAALCRGESIKLKIPKPILSCKYSTRDHPFFQIGPFKMEELSKDPDVTVFHNFMMENEMKRIIGIATPQLKISQHLKKGTKPFFETSTSRTSMHYFFDPKDDAEIDEILSRRIEAATGLKVAGSSDELQVVNYGIGGTYLPHLDYVSGRNHTVPRFFRLTGDRVASFLTYLGNVTLGGSTVFPLIGVSVPPEKGSAVFWYNTFKSGDGDNTLMHAGCPVVYGSKWIATKWVSSYNQMFKFPCGLNPMDRHTLL